MALAMMQIMDAGEKKGGFGYVFGWREAGRYGVMDWNRRLT